MDTGLQLTERDLGAACDLVSGSDAVADWSAMGARGHDLAFAIEHGIVPRLTLPRAAPPQSVRSGAAPVTAAAVESFAALALEHDASVALAYARRARAGGLSLAALCLDLLAPAARHLGDLWVEDLCDFAQVTIAVGRLQQVLREVTPPSLPCPSPGARTRRALLVPVFGEQHTLGLAMVTEFFRRAAWNVWSGVPADLDHLLALVRRNWFGVVGFSGGSERQVETMRSGIAAVRRASRNRRVGIMVGGPIFIEHPDLAALVGADATAVDGCQAVTEAQSLLARSAVRV